MTFDGLSTEGMTLGQFLPESVQQQQQNRQQQQRTQKQPTTAQERAEEYKRKQLAYCNCEEEREILLKPDEYPSLVKNVQARIARAMKEDWRKKHGIPEGAR